MTGIFLIGVMGLWLVAALLITAFITRKLPRRLGTFLIRASLFVVLLAAPLADEIIGGFQFRALCRAEAVMKVDEKKAAGKKLKLKLSDGKTVSNTLVAVREQTWYYLDAQNGEVLVSYKTLHAKGGWLIRTLGISETNAPLTFDNACGPAEAKTMFSRLNIEILHK